ncbi:uncharacterized protein H6S33_005251 [Morchella sextelata]|uniref:uncharacterized protein n=1 Tax=Morchella sextelata TaxID=1174677 RepID=UPI001D03C3F0|nr:uncharacterized protein H6S33_005251 [Morchella sextelata]KAH0605269.1 hypothetical protein H6S33_005251 [Morchella sextelata]
MEPPNRTNINVSGTTNLTSAPITPYHPPVLNLELVESRINLPTRKPRVAPRRLTTPIRPPPQYTLHAHQPHPYGDFTTIPLNTGTTTGATPAPAPAAPCTRRRDTILIAVMLLFAALAFAGALAVCVLLSLSNYSAMRGPVPVLIFAMAAFLVVAGGLVARVVCLWMRMRRSRCAAGGSDGGEGGSDGGEGGDGGMRVEVIEKLVAPPGYMDGLEGRDPLAGVPSAIGRGNLEKEVR